MSAFEISRACKIFLLLLPTFGLAHPVQKVAHIKTRADQLHDSYDYIIVGGGTSGLTVADRLTEDGTNSVLVVEYGPLEANLEILTPAIGLTNFPADMYNYTSLPQPGIRNQTAVLRGGAIVGGGSAVNSMFFDRGSAEDYDNWERLGNPGWGWKGILPYFQKSVTFTPPSTELETSFNITYNMNAAYGKSGPVHASYPPFQWPTAIAMFRGWKDFGIKVQQEGASGTAYGLFWLPASLNPDSQTRSYSRTAHYEPYIKRPNYHLITGYHANKMVFAAGMRAQGVEIEPRDNSGSPQNVTTITAKYEIILAAGSIQTPLILQRSGIGPKKILQSAGIEVKLDLPGVGQNLQDHSVQGIGYNFTKNPLPNRDMLSNSTYLADALAEYHQNKTGPITGADGCSGVFLPLPDVTPNFQSLIDEAHTQNVSQYLPSEYDPTVVKGFEAQKRILLSSFASNTTAIIEVPLLGRSNSGNINLKPLSRGSININPADTSIPVIDFGVLTNPIDLKVNIEAFKLTRKVYSSSAMAHLGPIETSPGGGVATDEDIEKWIRTVLLPSAAHPCGTSAMMPIEIGGVVGSDLLVHGVKRLSVVDASIMPLVPGTHLSATVYAVAEKAADIIKQRNAH
ncbi:alcohol oxidase [Halenospora varia]|nr:alcohol oxidase [Halenospora varia]